MRDSSGPHETSEVSRRSSVSASEVPRGALGLVLRGAVGECPSSAAQTSV